MGQYGTNATGSFWTGPLQMIMLCHALWVGHCKIFGHYPWAPGLREVPWNPKMPSIPQCPPHGALPYTSSTSNFLSLLMYMSILKHKILILEKACWPCRSLHISALYKEITRALCSLNGACIGLEQWSINSRIGTLPSDSCNILVVKNL